LTQIAIEQAGRTPAIRRGVRARLFRHSTPILFLMPAALLMAVFVAYPLVDSLVLSLYRWNGLEAREFIGLRNFEYLLTGDDVFWTSLQHNVMFSIGTTVGTVLIGFVLAVAIERRVHGWRFFKIVYFLPVMMPITVVGLLWGRIYDPTMGPLNALLHVVGVSSPPEWLGNASMALPAVIAVTIWQYSGFPMIILLAAMENIPTDLHDAATLDGVNVWNRVRHIIFPLVQPVFAVIIMLQIIFSFKVFDIVWVMTQGGPGEASDVLGVYLYKAAFTYERFGYGSAVAVMMSLIIFALSLVYLRFIRPQKVEF
jgi:ABC-type sugar transport system permease subunit